MQHNPCTLDLSASGGGLVVHVVKRHGGVFRSASAGRTRLLGKALATLLRPGDVVVLEGAIGAGKTTFVRGAAHGLGIRQPVTSPTFVLRKRYSLPRPQRGITAFHHVDAYRLSSATELRGALDDLAVHEGGSVWCVEWGRRYEKALASPNRAWRVVFRVLSKTGRRITIRLPRGR